MTDELVKKLQALMFKYEPDLRPYRGYDGFDQGTHDATQEAYAEFVKDLEELLALEKK
jgi:hypothetical protein